ncbi:MAG: hypothetical protein AAFO73_07930 [Pseudomonadota bacterium]
MKRHTLCAAAFAVISGMTTSAYGFSEAKLKPVIDEANITGAIGVKPVQSGPVYRYSSRVGRDGNVIVVLNEDKTAPMVKSSDVLTVFAPSVRSTQAILNSQDWYVTIDPSGGMRGIYTVPRDRSLPSSVLRSLGKGYAILKVSPSDTFFKVFPSKHQLASQLTTFTNGARDAVCSDARKPETISAEVDVKPGWSASGRIRFNATWKVAELCKKKSS